MAALSLSSMCLPKCLVPCNNNSTHMPVKIRQVKANKRPLQLQRSSVKIHAIAKEQEIGPLLAKGMDADLLKKYPKEEYTKHAPFLYNFAIEQLSFSHNLKEAFQLRECMEKRGLAPNSQTYFSLIMGLCLEGKIKEAEDLLYKTKSMPGCEPDELTYGAIIERLYNEEVYERGIELVGEMIQSGLTPAKVTVVGLVKALCKKGYYSRAIDFVHLTCQPKLDYYSCLIEAFELAGEPALAKDVLKLMQERGVDPDFKSYSCVFMGFIGKGLLDEAGRVQKEMETKGIKAPEAHKIWAEED